MANIGRSNAAGGKSSDNLRLQRDRIIRNYRLRRNSRRYAQVQRAYANANANWEASARAAGYGPEPQMTADGWPYTDYNRSRIFRTDIRRSRAMVRG